MTFPTNSGRVQRAGYDPAEGANDGIGTEDLSAAVQGTGRSAGAGRGYICGQAGQKLGVPANRRPKAGLLHHSDRGCQYASGVYQAKLAEFGIDCSMSGVGNCWDNAVAESLFASLKNELIHQGTFATRQEAKDAIFEWIEVWYNRKRRHSTLGYVSPVTFEAQQN